MYISLSLYIYIYIYTGDLLQGVPVHRLGVNLAGLLHAGVYIYIYIYIYMYIHIYTLCAHAM